MKAALLVETGKPLEIWDVFCSRLEYGQVKVKVLASGICGAQLQEISGEKKGGKLPHLIGHEGVGIVIEIGVGVTRMSVGDKVVMHWRKAAGIESPNPTYVIGGKSDRYKSPAFLSDITSGKVNTLTEEAICSENRLTPVTHDTPNDLCALLGCGLSTALGTIENEADLKFGETVLIIGCGGLGANLILASKLRQASRIVVVDVEQSKAKLAISLGAHKFMVPDDSLKLLPAFDVIVDTTGNFSAVRDAFQLLASGGRFIMVGQPKPGASMEIPNAIGLFYGEGKRIIATQGGQFRPHLDVPRYVAMWRAGLLNVEGLVTHRFPLNRINEGLDLVRSGQAGRFMVEM